MDKTTALVLVSHVHRTGINSAVRRLRAEGKSEKDALYEVILAAQETDHPALLAAACSMYEALPE